MAINQQGRDYTMPVPPGRHTFRHPGRHFRLLQCAIPVVIQLGDMSERTWYAGQYIALDRPDEFDRIEIENPLAVPLFVTYWAGYVAFGDDRRDNFESPTESVGLGVASVGASAAVDMVPAITGARVRRKAIIVSNFDPAVNLYVSDFSAANAGQGNNLATVGPGQCVILPISESCRVRNLTGGAVSCALGEIYWLRG